MSARLSAREKVERDRQIVADRARGLTWPTIATRYGLSERQCYDIARAQREERLALRKVDPAVLVEEQLEQLDDLVERLALLAECATHDAVKLGCLKAQLAALRERRELLQSFGVLPRDIGLLAQQGEAVLVAQRVVEVVGRHDVGRALIDEILDVLRPHAWVWRNGDRLPHPGAEPQPQGATGSTSGRVESGGPRSEEALGTLALRPNGDHRELDA